MKKWEKLRYDVDVKSSNAKLIYIVVFFRILYYYHGCDNILRTESLEFFDNKALLLSLAHK